ncbi:hypothetical protein CVT24_007695 [Panaeolus cyanescens]|uniref:Transposase family Tnp2 protein n=1 Tax=Panaeolus cyanescens TaxID=181874 RepID=A0A409VR96_9AGAR|nr:hypothetical protein CVT24_007695 [Panaeolus cyanescens]
MSASPDFIDTSQPSTKMVHCDCGCDQTVSYATRKAHREGKGPLLLQAQRLANKRFHTGNNAEMDIDIPASFESGHSTPTSNVDEPMDQDAHDHNAGGDSPQGTMATDPFGISVAESTQRTLQQEYSHRLVGAKKARWPVVAHLVGNQANHPKHVFVADHPSDDDIGESSEEEEDDLPPPLTDSDDSEEDEIDDWNDDDDGDGEEGHGDEEMDGEEDDARIRNNTDNETEDGDIQMETAVVLNALPVLSVENEEDLVAASAFAARREAAEAVARRIHDSEAQGISERDAEILRTFVLKVEDHLSQSTFGRLPQAYPNHDHLSLKLTTKRARLVSGFDAVQYHCCINSCICFVGPYANLTQCPHCKEDRFTSRNGPRNHFDYIPLIPRLTAMISNTAHAELMTYRAKHKHRKGIIADIFDGTHYRELCGTPLADGGRNHFSDPRDIALGLSTDGFGPHRRRKKTCWPIILLNYNLPPTVRVQKKYIINIGTVPGPKKPQDWDSFFWPLAQELLELEAGVEAFDALSKSLFKLRAHLLVAFGDMPAVSLIMRMKGQNGISPCRFCLIKGNTGGGRTNYIPLCRHGLDEDDYDASNLPMRSHQGFMDHIAQIEGAATTAQRDLLATEYGIKGMPLLNDLSSIYFPDSFPLDFMHLIWENLIPNLIRFWKKEFKDLDHKRMGYVISTNDWNAIGLASGTSGRTIPSAFGAPIPNLATQQYYMTAEMYSNWTLFVAPIVLRDRFPDKVYYTHFMQLHRLLKLCLDLELTDEEINTIQKGFEEWVDEYERLYYRYDKTRLSACPLTIHALLHISWGIRMAGPIGGYWAFVMERHCNTLLPAVRNRRHPYPSISRFVTASAQLDQIRLMYDADGQLDLDPVKPEPKTVVYRRYSKYRLLQPRRKEHLSDALKNLVWVSLVTRFTTTENPITRNTVRDLVPLEDEVVQFGKVRIGDGAEQISGCDFVSKREDSRDSTFLKYVQLVDKRAHRRGASVFVEQEFFGQLKRILVIDLPKLPQINVKKAQTIVFALVQIATTEKKYGFHSFKRMGRNDLVDLKTVKCVVGRVWDREQWTIVDRT